MRRLALLLVSIFLLAMLAAAQTAPAYSTAAQQTTTPATGNSGIGSTPAPPTQQGSTTSTPQPSSQTQTTTPSQTSMPPQNTPPPQSDNAPQTGTTPQTAPQPTAPATTNAPSQSSEPVLKPRPSQSTGPVLNPRPAEEPAQPTHIPMARTVQVGTQMDVTLDRTLSSKTSHPGDEFFATLVDPLRNSSGTVLVPAGSKIRGEVANAESGRIFAQLRGKGSIALRFLDIRLPDGTAMPIQATLLSVHDTKGTKSGSAKTDEEGQVTGGTSGKSAAKDVGIGAGVGTIAGLIFGGALKGLAIGAIAGGGYVLANAGKDVEIPSNSGLKLRLDQNLTLPATSSTPQIQQPQQR